MSGSTLASYYWYMPNWSQEHFIVDKVNIHTKRRVYKLKDYADEEISGTWYEKELQPIKKNLYLIEKVLRKRKAARGEQELFVKWKGWPTNSIPGLKRPIFKTSRKQNEYWKRVPVNTPKQHQHNFLTR